MMNSHPDIRLTARHSVAGSRRALSDQDLPAADDRIPGYRFALDRIERVEIRHGDTGRWITEHVGAPAAARLVVTSDISIWVGADGLADALPNQLASALVQRLLHSTAAGGHPVDTDGQERIRGMLGEPGPRLEIDCEEIDCHGLFAGDGPSGEAVSLPPAFEASWQALEEGRTGQSAITIMTLRPPGGQLMVGWPRNQG